MVYPVDFHSATRLPSLLLISARLPVFADYRLILDHFRDAGGGPATRPHGRLSPGAQFLCYAAYPVTDTAHLKILTHDFCASSLSV
jgi:hypothetical protein